MTPMDTQVPEIDIAPLFGAGGAGRDQVDSAIHAAARDIGFMLIRGFPPVPANAALLRLFELAPTERARLWRAKFRPGQPNQYRGWFPLQNGLPTYKEGMDLGPDIAHGPSRIDPGDPLCEATPLPPEELLPGWRADMARYYLAMEQVGEALLRSLARSLGLPEAVFAEAFAGGISTLRLLHYPVRPPESFDGAKAGDIRVEHLGRLVDLAGAAHVDSGFVTLLAQDGVPGLQAQARDGSWIDVPPVGGTLAVNFGKLLERWTGGRIRATRHRVIAHRGRSRHSIPFFYEPRVDAEITPVPGMGEAFAPFLYGDHLWAAMCKFVEFQGLDHLRQPRWKAAGWPE